MHLPELRMRSEHWQQLQRLFEPSFRTARSPEVGAIGILGRSQGADRHEYLLADLLLPGPGDFTTATDRALTFGASYIRRAHVAMRQRKLAGLIMFHTHPLSDDYVGFSPFDDQQEPQLYRNLLDIYPATEFLSVVAGKRSMCGRLWTPQRTVLPLGRLVVVGDTLFERQLDGQPPPPPPEPSALFDRSLPLTGAGALARLSRMKIAVVGASGTGSIAVEVLMRAGCQEQMLIDDDVCKDVNGTRILHSSQLDCDTQRPKVEVLKNAIESIGFGCQVEAIRGNILDHNVLMRLRDADLIVGCVDAAFPRYMLCKFAYQYLRPYIDVGSEIGADAEGVVALNARANYIAPGRWCLQCAGIVTDRRLRFESKSYEERARELSLGYSDDLILKQPAVMELNMRATTLGTMLLRHLLQPYLSQPIPVTILENLVTLSVRAYPSAKNANTECPLCQKNTAVGFGDCGPTLGLNSSSLKRKCSIHASIGVSGRFHDASLSVFGGAI